MEQLRSMHDPPRALHLALLLLYLKVTSHFSIVSQIALIAVLQTFGVPVHCPGRAASLLLRGKPEGMLLLVSRITQGITCSD